MAVLAFVAFESALFKSGIADASFRLLMGQGEWLGMIWLLIISLFSVIGVFASTLAHNKKRPIQYMGLFLYVVMESILFMPMLCMARLHSDPYIVPSAALVTLIMFASLSAYVILTGARFGFLGGFISVLSIATICVIVAALVFGLHLGVFFSVVMVALAGMCVLYETSNICDEYGEEYYVGAALSLFSSVALMFWYVLRIMMSSDK